MATVCCDRCKAVIHVSAQSSLAIDRMTARCGFCNLGRLHPIGQSPATAKRGEPTRIQPSAGVV